MFSKCLVGNISPFRYLVEHPKTGIKSRVEIYLPGIYTHTSTLGKLLQIMMYPNLAMIIQVLIVISFVMPNICASYKYCRMILMHAWGPILTDKE